MTLSRPFSHFSGLSIFILLLLSLCGCRVAPLHNIHNAPIAINSQPHPDMQTVEEAILRAGKDLGWRMTPTGAGHIVGILDIRTHQAVVDITYSATTYDITYKDSKKLRYNHDKSTIHSNYNGWINNLHQAIQRELTYAK